jgi:long-chain acyl-CoA synthetase
VPAPDPGETVVLGRNLMKGCPGRPDASEAAVVDGWFRTGDLGTLDAGGFISILDRKKDVVIRGGFNVYPREVEEVLARHPAVAQVAVVGLPDPEHGEEICAVVVPRPGATLDPDEVLAWSRERLGRHMYPRRLEIVDSLPLGPSLKVLKRELRARFGGPAG